MNTYNNLEYTLNYLFLFLKLMSTTVLMQIDVSAQ